MWRSGLIGSGYYQLVRFADIEPLAFFSRLEFQDLIFDQVIHLERGVLVLVAGLYNFPVTG